MSYPSKKSIVLLLKQCAISVYKIAGDGIIIVDMFRCNGCIGSKLNIIFSTAALFKTNK